MVDILGKTPFASATLLQEPFGRLRPLLLELGPEATVAGAHLIDMAVLWPSRGVQKLTIAGRRQLDDAQVHAHKLIGISRRWLRSINGNGKEELVVAVEQIGLPACALQHPVGVCAKA